MIKKWHTRFHKTLAEKVFLDAQRVFLIGTQPTPAAATNVARLMACLVLATPLLFAGLGVIFIWSVFPSPVGFLFGGAMIGAAFYLRPRRARMPSPIRRREELPQLFAFVDEISDALGAPRITGIYLDDSLNAFVCAVRGEVTLGIGALLWISLTENEKRALVGHEMAHLVNKDPARGTLLRMALETLEGWTFLFDSPAIVDNDEGVNYRSRTDIFEGIVGGVFEVALGGITFVMERFSYFEQQKAEYLADALSMRAAGRMASLGLLGKLELAQESLKYGHDLTFSTPLRGVEFLEHIVAPLRVATDEDLRNALENSTQQGRAIDAAHPPTHYRMSFLKCLPDPEILVSKIDVSQMDAELQPIWQELGESWRYSLEVQ